MSRFSLASIVLVVLLAPALLGQSNPVPFVNQPLVPATVAPGASAFTLTVNGTGFVSGSVVNWNGSARATTFVNSSQLTATILATDVAVAETGTVTVSSPGPGGGVSNSLYLGVTNPFRQITFASSSLGNPSEPILMTSADLNGDGRSDLITVNVNGSVSVFLGNGDGTFQTERDYVVLKNNDLSSVVAVDLNGDGKLDLAVCVVETAQLAVLLGNGDGTFGTPSFYSTGGSSPQVLAAGDFNGDGFIDIVVTNYGSNTVGLLLGNGDGSFRASSTSAVGFEPYFMTVGDFNKDGKLDLIASSPIEGYFSILLGKGDGSFGTPTNIPAGINPAQLVAADFDGDGNLDVAVVNENDALVNTVSVFLGNGDGTFKPLVQYDVGSSPYPIALGDLDGDGRLDLIVLNASFSAPTLSVLYGNGDGTFQPQAVFQTTVASTIALGDFNGDGRLDIGDASQYFSTASLLIQIPSVNLSPTSLSFPNQVVGTSSSAQTVVLTNASNTPLTISSITITGTNANAFVQSNTCPATLNAGGNCTISVTYVPPLVESDTATLTVKDSGAPGTQTVALSGNSIGPVVALSSTGLNFGKQVVGTVSGPQTVILANTGTIPLTITSLAANGNFSQTNTCGASVAVGGSCSMTVRFNPAVIGNRMGSVTIKDNAGPPTQIITLFGVGTDVSLSTTSLVFPPQKVGTTRPPSNVRLTNVGGTTLTFSGFAISGPSATDFAQTNNCGSSLAAGRSCTIAVTFTPTATGSRNASLDISDNGGGSPQKVMLTGTGK
jgi:FG-GAP-like repeat/HYDIN/CFA65/VesB-like, Ig-like domain/Cep192 domain 4